jgi:hypothetical protein
MNPETARLLRALRYNNAIHARAVWWCTLEGGGLARQMAGKTRSQLAAFHWARRRQSVTTFGEAGHKRTREFLKKHFDKPLQP